MTLTRSLASGGYRLLASLWNGWADLATHVGILFAWQQDADTARVAQAVARAAAYDAQVLRHAAYANSPHEVDWLLYAAMMTGAAKKRYCLERALAINPDSDLAHRAIAKLAWNDPRVRLYDEADDPRGLAMSS